MKKIIYLILPIFIGVFSGCSDFLEVPPQAIQTESSFFENPANAVLAINGIYDVIGQSEGAGPDGQWMQHNYDWFYSDLLTDDCEKGSTEADLADVQALAEWRAIGTNTVIEPIYMKCFDGISRCNVALKALETSSLDGVLKSRLQGEAYFLKGYFYFNLLRIFGGVPIFEKPLTPAEFGKVQRASLHETYNYAAGLFVKAAGLLPQRSKYDLSELGRATKGAAQGLLARLYLYQIGMDAENAGAVTYQMVYDLTNEIMVSGEYSLLGNYAQLFEFAGENCSESIFEVQMLEGSTANNPLSTGTNLSQLSGNRKDWGWGFWNPSQDLFDAFEPQDPRLSCTVYGESYNNGIVQGVKNVYDLTGQMTPYLNRKTALAKAERPAILVASGYNLRIMRYTEILFIHAEAAIELGKSGEAEDLIEVIRNRARNSTLARGSKEGELGYQATGWSNNLPRLAVPADRNLAIEVLLKEKRVEMSQEYLRFMDLVRHGKYLDMLDHKRATFKSNDGVLRYQNINLRANCLSKCINGPGSVRIPLMPIPQGECDSWGLLQNNGY